MYDFWRPGCNSCFQNSIGANRIVCVFDRPTETEEEARLPVMGVTGANLCLLLRVLRNSKGMFAREYGPDLFRRNVSILNAYKKNGDLNSAKIKSFDWTNKLVLCFGKNAARALESCDVGGVINVYHLGVQGLLSIKHLDEVCEILSLPIANRAAAKIFIIAEYILRMVESNKGRICFGDFIKPFQRIGNQSIAGLLSFVLNVDLKRVFSSQCSFECCRHCNECKIEGSY